MPGKFTSSPRIGRGALLRGAELRGLTRKKLDFIRENLRMKSAYRRSACYSFDFPKSHELVHIRESNDVRCPVGWLGSNGVSPRRYDSWGFAKPPFGSEPQGRRRPQPPPPIHF